MTARLIRFPLPAMYALDEHGPWLEPLDGCGPHPRDVSKFTWQPGVAALLDMTDPQFPHRRVLLDVDTLQTERLDRVELDGKVQLEYDPDEVRQHVEKLVEAHKTLRIGRYDTKITARALRRLAAGGARSSWPIGERLNPEHPLEDRHWIPTGLTHAPRHARHPAPAKRPPETRETRPARPAPKPATMPARRGGTDYDRLVEQTLDAWPEFRQILGAAR